MLDVVLDLQWIIYNLIYHHVSCIKWNFMHIQASLHCKHTQRHTYKRIRNVYSDLFYLDNRAHSYAYKHINYMRFVVVAFRSVKWWLWCHLICSLQPASATMANPSISRISVGKLKIRKLNITLYSWHSLNLIFVKLFSMLEINIWDVSFWISLFSKVISLCIDLHGILHTAYCTMLLLHRQIPTINYMLTFSSPCGFLVFSWHQKFSQQISTTKLFRNVVCIAINNLLALHNIDR